MPTTYALHLNAMQSRRFHTFPNYTADSVFPRLFTPTPNFIYFFSYPSPLFDKQLSKYSFPLAAVLHQM